MKCPHCGEQSEGRNANNRYIRCTHCNGILPVPVSSWKAQQQLSQSVEPESPKKEPVKKTPKAPAKK